MLPNARPGSRSWMWIALPWLGLGLFDAMQTVLVMQSEGMHHKWVTLFVVTVVSWLPWALATPVAVRLGYRFPHVRLRPYRTWLVHAAACAAIGACWSAWTVLLDILFNPYASADIPRFLPSWIDKFENGLLSSIVLYAGILTISYALESRTHLARAATETARLNEWLTKAQLDALRRQIEPHFLFNTLNAVAGLVREGRGDAAVRMIAALSDLLRRMLDDVTRHEVPLREEMALIQDYLDIQRVRFEDRLAFTLDVPSELESATVPNLILQPLVENAITHGIAKRASGGNIRIAASRSNGTLLLCVSNDGPSGPADSAPSGSGIGIANVRTRLKSLYGDASDVRMQRGSAGVVEVSLWLPLRSGPSPT
jgi:two-component system LytT family sensor kinase